MNIDKRAIHIEEHRVISGMGGMRRSVLRCLQRIGYSVAFQHEKTPKL